MSAPSHRSRARLPHGAHLLGLARLAHGARLLGLAHGARLLGLAHGARPLGLAALLTAITLGAPANAQEVATAEALFDHGLAEMEAGHHEKGCPLLAESHRIDPRPGTLFTLAVCESRWGRVASASSRFGDFLTLYDKLPPAQQTRQRERARVARGERERLRGEIPQLTLTLPSDAPAGTVVERDGTVLGAATLGLSLPMDPGEHTLATQVPGGRRWEQRITLARGEKREIVLQLRRPEGTASPTRPSSDPDQASVERAAVDLEAPPGGSGQRTAAYVVGGLGGLGLVLGGVTGALALGAKSDVDERCGAAIGASDPLACTQEGLDALGRTKTLGWVSTVGFGVGAVGLGTAVVLLLTDGGSSSKTTGQRSPTLRPDVVFAGPEGGLLGVRGTW
ncbi:hypothetical protein [Chondromyces crocatus]|uniref:PEGA domain-containing protein n=1 Tax=Chondromyces crocatus TaxID=52 RepID=A0A0K1E8U4_CHOCO|nr:hypothetical protein [Chondromyces crocatus]AKT37301.1 uncharacterized protein CMC5_014330 [Chondromyces crocatus]